MEPVSIVVGAALGLVLGFVITRALGLGRSAAAERATEAEIKKLLGAAERETAEIKKAGELEGQELAQKIKLQAEDEQRQRRSELGQKEESVAQREKQLSKQRADDQRTAAELDRREKALDSRERAAEAMASRAEAEQRAARSRLEELSGMTAEQARERLTGEVIAEARAMAATEVKQIEETAAAEAAAKSKTIIATAIQRYASEFVAERTVSVVPLPSDDMKGRLIGREGRNIRALEAAAGIDLIIDDTAEAITVSCFNPVRREIARLAISKLVADGRIHPTRIEEVVATSEREVEESCRAAGEQAVFDLGLHRVHPELIGHLGRLKFRQSYAQNLLQHSIEVGFLAGLLAAELDLNVKLARRAGLFHDIGRALDQDHEGTHAEAGALLCKKHGESPKVWQAIAAHHGNPPPASLFDHVLDAANQLSSARPGARREQLAAYAKRLDELERLAVRHDGVTRAFAIQAGREVRVLVENDKIDDAQAHILSRDIARTLEAEATYPGQIRVVVVRETRASDYAR